MYFLSPSLSKAYCFNLTDQRVRTLDITKYTVKMQDYSAYCDPNGTVMISGGYLLPQLVEVACIFVTV
jgi:hypothetical protein